MELILISGLSGAGKSKVASFLEDKDYADPSSYVPTAKNTVTIPFKVSERYPDFEKKYVKPALKWWKDHVETGISPAYDERKDAEILKALRTNNLSPETNLEELVREAEELMKDSRRVVKDALAYCNEHNIHEWGQMKNRVKDDLSQFLYQKTKRSPMILPIIMEI